MVVGDEEVDICRYDELRGRIGDGVLLLPHLGPILCCHGCIIVTWITRIRELSSFQI